MLQNYTFQSEKQNKSTKKCKSGHTNRAKYHHFQTSPFAPSLYQAEIATYLSLTVSIMALSLVNSLSDMVIRAPLMLQMRCSLNPKYGSVRKASITFWRTCNDSINKRKIVKKLEINNLTISFCRDYWTTN